MLWKKILKIRQDISARVRTILQCRRIDEFIEKKEATLINKGKEMYLIKKIIESSARLRTRLNASWQALVNKYKILDEFIEKKEEKLIIKVKQLETFLEKIQEKFKQTLFKAGYLGELIWILLCVLSELNYIVCMTVILSVLGIWPLEFSTGIEDYVGNLWAQWNK